MLQMLDPRAKYLSKRPQRTTLSAGTSRSFTSLSALSSAADMLPAGCKTHAPPINSTVVFCLVAQLAIAGTCARQQSTGHDRNLSSD